MRFGGLQFQRRICFPRTWGGLGGSSHARDTHTKAAAGPGGAESARGAEMGRLDGWGQVK